MEVIGSLYTETSEDFFRGLYPIARCVKAEKHDLGVVMAEVKVIGSLESKFERTNRIYDIGGVSPTLSTMQGGNQEPKIIVRMCGRNPDRPTDRTPGLPTEQRIEPNAQGISGCLTSVQKDNELLEIVRIKQATSRGSIECEIGGCFDAGFPGSKTRRGRVQDNGNTCPTLTAQNQEIVLIETQYSIRKLTPRECGRLMGVSDEDITKMAAVNSNSQLYKQFGNSIVVDVMCEMFKNLGIGRRNEQQTNDEKSTAGKAHETDHRQP